MMYIYVCVCTFFVLLSIYILSSLFIYYYFILLVDFIFFILINTIVGSNITVFGRFIRPMHHTFLLSLCNCYFYIVHLVINFFMQQKTVYGCTLNPLLLQRIFPTFQLQIRTTNQTVPAEIFKR